MADQPQSKNKRDSAELPASVIFMELMRQAAAKSPKPAEPEIAPDPVETESDLPISAEAMPTEVIDSPDELSETESPPVIEAEATPVIDQAVAAPPLTDEQRRQAADLERERLRRIKRRQEKRREHRVSVLGGILRSFLVVIPSAILIATILSWWTSPEFLQPETRQDIMAALALEGITPTPSPTVEPNFMRRIGIVSGHRGIGLNGEVYDPGAVCPDGLEENQINFRVATLVVIDLRGRGYTVDLLDEFDPRLQDYQADALVSIHANDCRDYGNNASGFIVAKAAAKPEGGIDTVLAECIAKHYGDVTEMNRWTTLTRDMTEYHSFREIHPRTPAAIIELGFMFADREILTERPDLLSRGIVNGILCFLEPEGDLMLVTPAPTLIPTLIP
ncbi:MAG: N-acetylmuramoyl-L-alanine amidase [Anaerolineae bacterium]|nr:N-acetylmuramoyl-L-alanine amidase [Anaerolineae bacterium]